MNSWEAVFPCVITDSDGNVTVTFIAPGASKALSL